MVEPKVWSQREAWTLLLWSDKSQDASQTHMASSDICQRKKIQKICQIKFCKNDRITPIRHWKEVCPSMWHHSSITFNLLLYRKLVEDTGAIWMLTITSCGNPAAVKMYHSRGKHQALKALMDHSPPTLQQHTLQSEDSSQSSHTVSSSQCIMGQYGATSINSWPYSLPLFRVGDQCRKSIKQLWWSDACLCIYAQAGCVWIKNMYSAFSLGHEQIHQPVSCGTISGSLPPDTISHKSWQPWTVEPKPRSGFLGYKSLSWRGSACNPTGSVCVSACASDVNVAHLGVWRTPPSLYCPTLQGHNGLREMEENRCEKHHWCLGTSSHEVDSQDVLATIRDSLNCTDFSGWKIGRHDLDGERHRVQRQSEEGNDLSQG